MAAGGSGSRLIAISGPIPGRLIFGRNYVDLVVPRLKFIAAYVPTTVTEKVSSGFAGLRPARITYTLAGE